jgi:glycosyltransferase involved in cell wall biosynthesis
MSHAITRLLTDEDARRRIAASARGWAKSELAWARTADRYDDLYVRLEQRRGGRARRRQARSP